MFVHLKKACTAVLSMIVYVLLLPYIIVRILLLKVIWPMALKPMCVAILYPFSNIIHGQDPSFEKETSTQTPEVQPAIAQQNITFTRDLDITSFSRTLIRGRAQWVGLIVLGLVWIIMHHTAAPLFFAQWGITPQMIYLPSAVFVFVIAWGLQSWFNRTYGDKIHRQTFCKHVRAVGLKPEESKVILVCLAPLKMVDAQEQLNQHNEYAAVFYIDSDKMHDPPKSSFTKRQEYHKQLIAEMLQEAHALRRGDLSQYTCVQVRAKCVKSSPLISALASLKCSQTGQEDLKKTAMVFEHPINSWFALLFNNPKLLSQKIVELCCKPYERFFTKCFFDAAWHHYRLNIHQVPLKAHTAYDPIDTLIERLTVLKKGLNEVGKGDVASKIQALSNQIKTDCGGDKNDPIPVPYEIKHYVLTILSLIQAELDAQTGESPKAKTRMYVSQHLDWHYALMAFVRCSIGLILDVSIFLILELVFVPLLRCLDWVFYRPKNKDMTEWLRDWIRQGVFVRFLKERLEHYPAPSNASTGLINATVPKESSVVGALFPNQTLGSDIRSWMHSMPYQLRLWYFNGLVAFSLASILVPSIIALMSLCGVTLTPSALFVLLGVPVSQSMCILALTLILCVTHRVYNMMVCEHLSSEQHKNMCPADSLEVVQNLVSASIVQDPYEMNIHLLPPSRAVWHQVTDARKKHFESSLASSKPG